MCEVVIIDDDKALAETFGQALSPVTSIAPSYGIVGEGADALSLAERVIAQLNGNGDAVLLINIDLSPGRHVRQRSLGVEILTWLRIRGVMNHSFLYSFQSLPSLARKDLMGLVLLSKGTTFIQLPASVPAVVARTKWTHAEVADLKRVLRAVFNESLARHREANWWGLKALWDVHSVATGNPGAPYPEDVRARLQVLNNAVGAFLHGQEVKNINQVVDEKRQELLNRRDDLLRREASILQRLAEQQKSVADCEELVRLFKEDLEKNLIAQQYSQSSPLAYAEAQSRVVTSRQEIADASEKLDAATQAVEDLNSELSDTREQQQRVQRQITTFIKSSAKEIVPAESQEVGQNAKILLVDDNAERGWKSAFESILVVDIKSAAPDVSYKGNVDGVFSLLRADLVQLKSAKRPLIILDLRLFGEDGRISVEETSGCALLRRIRKEFSKIPILISTASNKAHSFHALVKEGADAYWVKEGLDEFRSSEESVENYVRLRELIALLTGDRYLLMGKMWSFSEQFAQSKATHWSRNVQWQDGSRTEGDVDGIAKALVEAAYAVKQYLHTYELQYGARDSQTEAFILSGIINKLGGVLEYVHGMGGVLSELAAARGDEEQFHIRRLRNIASHRDWTAVNWRHLESCFNETKKYLKNPPKAARPISK